MYERLDEAERAMDAMLEQFKTLLMVYRKTRDGYHNMIVEAAQLIAAGAQMGQSNVDSHVLVELCNKHSISLGKINSLLSDDDAK